MHLLNQIRNKVSKGLLALFRFIFCDRPKKLNLNIFYRILFVIVFSQNYCTYKINKKTQFRNVN